jgi:alkanesulfonate monooxygenase SsuD/methylene tetrahydromethanopterin reductase-like flavin-dependent oxidoreductase (luciferase family)
VVLLAALAGVTQRIGLIATASTTYNEPYNLARRFGSLDFISRGRAGWNVVTTAGVDAARNFNLDELPPHRERYARAAEFVDVFRTEYEGSTLREHYGLARPENANLRRNLLIGAA